MATRKKKAGAEQEDPLAYVVRRLKDMPSKKKTKIAGDTELARRTIDTIINGHTPQYTTVMKLHAWLKKDEQESAPA